MNPYFIKGFLKIAEPELAKQTSSGADWNNSGEYRFKRQKLLEFYEGNDKALNEKESVTKNDANNKNPNDYATHRGTGYDG